MSAAAAVDPKGQRRAFAVTWLAYASYYLGRKGIPVARAAIYEAFGKSALNGVETVYLAMYAIGQFVSGGIGDRAGARRLVGFGMLLSALACVGFGLSSLLPLFVLAMFINGLAQSTGWPGNIKAMAEWVPSARRGRVMGLWATCYQVGGIAASFVTRFFLNAYGVRGAFIGPALAVAAVGILVLLALRQGPLAPRGSDAGHDGAPDPALLEERRAARRRVLRSVTIWSYGASYFCIKLVRYSLLFWLPYYMEKQLGYTGSAAAFRSTSFEIGGVLGALVLGALSDLRPRTPRSIFAAVSLIGLSGALYLYIRIGGSSPFVNFALMALVGALLFGPDALLSGAAAQDAGGPFAAALAAGLVNGLGSIGGVLEELVTRGVSDRWGWTPLFHAWAVISLLGAVSLTPTFSGKGRAPTDIDVA